MNNRAIGATYFYVSLNEHLEVGKGKDDDISKHRIRFAIGNYFATDEQAQAIKTAIADLLTKKYRGRKTRSIGKRYYFIYLLEIMPKIVSAIDGARKIDNNRHEVGNYFSEEDAITIQKEIADILERTNEQPNNE